MQSNNQVKQVKVATWTELQDRIPANALIADVDLVIIRYDNQVSVFFGRCLHRGALLADGYIEGNNLICGLHFWDYRFDTGVSDYNNEERLQKFSSWIDETNNAVYVDENEIRHWTNENPQPYDRNSYLGKYADIHGTPEEPHNNYISELARNGLKNFGHHGQTSAMGVPLTELPRWDGIQIVTAQLAHRPLMDDEPVKTKLAIGYGAKKPLVLDIPIFVSDMSFGALSAEAKTALAIGAEMAGTGICSGEGGMLPEASDQRFRRYLHI